jgi:hypothetical protein
MVFANVHVGTSMVCQHAVYEPGTHFGVLPEYEHKTPVQYQMIKL